VDDDASVRTALTRLLRAAGHKVQPWASANEFLSVEAWDAPGCVVLDLRMAEMDGLELQQALAQRQSALPIIFLTGHGDIATGVRAMKAGAVDFLTKPVKGEALLEAVGNALARDGTNRVAHDGLHHLQQCYATLTPREREVFALLAAGATNKRIAVDIGAAERTVKLHRKHVMAKMKAVSIADLVRAADRLRASSSL